MLTDSTLPQTVIDIHIENSDDHRNPTNLRSHAAYMSFTRFWQAAGSAGKYTLDTIDSVGEKVADFFGITAPKYSLYLEEALDQAQKHQSYLVQTSITENARRKNPYLGVPDSPKHFISSRLFAFSSSKSNSPKVIGEL
ncbi:hypothetical protein HMI54_006664 [Coelomomyces lativittatus]|nr:hypothetical protein HMI56_005468 [Coelomomyces lativittatus]KAJ1517180.1 hypothetical protein HMI54_006664 [Coelomomyces lativittatus]KAJ1517962.1 hypothetical protein HMI55_004496 [Coelomomyces lativittatus]